MISARISRVGITVMSMMLLVTVAFSWLIFPYMMNGKEMLFETGEQVRGERFSKYSSLNRRLTRFIPFPGGIDVSVLYASQEYFEYADRSNAVEVYRPDTHLVFFVKEDVHTGYLPRGLPAARLVIDGKDYQPASAEGPEWVEHHRTTILRFARVDEDNNPIITADTSQIDLKLGHPWDRANLEEGGEPKEIEATFLWELPLDIPAELMSRTTFTNAMMFSLSAGLLSSVLTPCLLQLVIIFFATLGGVSAKEVVSNEGITPEVRKKVLWVASWFVAGYVALFVASGALIGYIGKESQLFFATYSRAVGMIAGVIVILFGLWLGIRSRAPVLCKVPGADMIEKMEGRGTLGTVLVAIAFSLGCMSCFGGAIIGTLFIYVGALGSAAVGATVMGIFAAGIAVPFLLAAIFFSRMSVLFEFVARHSRMVGTVSALIIVAFGLMLLTDNFHTVSDAIYPYLGLD
jgi:cytochrome c-type biogenesis protein